MRMSEYVADDPLPVVTLTYETRSWFAWPTFDKSPNSCVPDTDPEVHCVFGVPFVICAAP